MAPAAEHTEVEVSGRTVTISSPDKVFFAERGETKLDLVRYYQAVEQPLLRAIGGRPILLERYPDGASGKSFFQKRVPKTAPDWLETHGRGHAERHGVGRAGGGRRRARACGP